MVTASSCHYLFLFRVSELSFSVDDLITYAHLLSVSLNFELCQGKICEAGRAGEYRTTTCICVLHATHKSTV